MSSSSSIAMSAARDAAGSSTTWPSAFSSSAGSGGLASEVTGLASEQVAAEKVRGVGPLHVRTGMHHHVPVAARGRVVRLDRGPCIGCASAVRDHLVQGKDDV